jgi:hypothetical protein
MGASRQLAEAVDLARLQPRGDLASTGYALVYPGREYLVLRPEDHAEHITVTVSPGTYTVRWQDLAGRDTIAAEQVGVDHARPVTLASPFGATVPALLHLTSTVV